MSLLVKVFEEVVLMRYPSSDDLCRDLGRMYAIRAADCDVRILIQGMSSVSIWSGGCELDVVAFGHSRCLREKLGA